MFEKLKKQRTESADQQIAKKLADTQAKLEKANEDANKANVALGHAIDENKFLTQQNQDLIEQLDALERQSVCPLCEKVLNERN